MNGEDAHREHSGVANFIIHRFCVIVQVNIPQINGLFLTFNCPFAGAVFCYAYCKKRRCLHGRKAYVFWLYPADGGGHHLGVSG
uniref:Uncharacterized protein n=1 Tax=Siphoviridae sp. ctjsp22 TaxID=2825636 RepID=A0A8S5V540_9CAUD|nr:MAG TPA: hypothetical protein [Siphoviridae sp. ctjsp22]